MLWNRDGHLSKSGDTLVCKTPTKTIRVFTTATHVDDYYVQVVSPYLAIPLTEALGICTGTPRTVDEIRQILDRQKASLQQRAGEFGDLAEAFLAVQAGIAWNLIYEPKYDRVVSTVWRRGNEEYGGDSIF